MFGSRQKSSLTYEDALKQDALDPGDATDVYLFNLLEAQYVKQYNEWEKLQMERVKRIQKELKKELKSSKNRLGQPYADDEIEMLLENFEAMNAQAKKSEPGFMKPIIPKQLLGSEKWKEEDGLEAISHPDDIVWTVHGKMGGLKKSDYYKKGRSIAEQAGDKHAQRYGTQEKQYTENVEYFENTFTPKKAIMDLPRPTPGSIGSTGSPGTARKLDFDGAATMTPVKSTPISDAMKSMGPLPSSFAGSTASQRNAYSRLNASDPSPTPGTLGLPGLARMQYEAQLQLNKMDLTKRLAHMQGSMYHQIAKNPLLAAMSGIPVDYEKILSSSMRGGGRTRKASDFDGSQFALMSALGGFGTTGGSGSAAGGLDPATMMLLLGSQSQSKRRRTTSSSASKKKKPAATKKRSSRKFDYYI